MKRFRFALAAAVLAAGGALVSFVRPTALAAAAQAAPAPGQLAILDREGRPGALCPLEHTSVAADVAGYVSRVSVRQVFSNPSKEPVEAVYTFPLPEDAAVDDMTMTVGDRVIKGQIKRREEARAIYEAAKSAGQSAALLDQERPNIFTQSVANLMPGQKVTISISYVNLLKYDDGKYEFVFPMVVGPRYTPGGGYSRPGERGAPSPVSRIEGNPGAVSVVTDADRITPPITPPATRAGHDISLTVNLDAGLPLQDVTATSHEVNVNRNEEHRATVRLKSERTIPNKDFILRFGVAGEQIRTGVLAHAPEGKSGYFTLILQPPASTARPPISPKEMVFVIDQTGSQSGEPIRKSKETMRFCIENLNPGDTFQLIGFNTQVYPCFSQPVPVTPENVDRALKWLEPIEGRGGTDILKSVDYALRIPDDPGRLRMICYMTDGYVGNDMQIIQYIRQNRGRARMFPFGIGNSVNRFLIEGMAREGRGAAEIVTLNTPGEKAASKYYARVANPLLLDPQVEWNGLPVDDVYPKHIPDVFTAGPIILKGRYARGAEGEITVRGLLRGQPWSQTVKVSFPKERKEGSAIATLWAREKIEDLQAEDWVGAQTGSPRADIKERITALALDYRLMSQYTSFVAVEQRVVNVGGKQRRIDVPVEMPEGVSYEGIFGREAERLVRARGAVTNFYSTSGGAAAGFGGAALGAVPQQAQTPAPAGLPGPPGRRLSEALLQRDKSESRGEGLADGLALGKEAALKKLAELPPADRKAVLEEAKLAPRLRGLAELLAKEGRNGTLRKPGVPEVEKGRVEVQVWLNELPPDGLKKLKTLGFDLAAALTPGKLLLGTVAVEKLDALIELPFVRRVEPPRYL
jgi:Ca-activated chloride channel family protein